MPDLMSRLRQIEDEDKKRKAQRDAQEQQARQFVNNDHRNAFYKWAHNKFDRDWYRTGKTGYQQPTEQEFYNAKKLFDKNYARKQQRQPALDFGNDLSINPTDYTDEYLQYHSNYVKKNGRPQNIQDVHKYANQQRYKGQYGNTVEDTQNELNGLKPMKYQVNDSVRDELNSYAQRAIALRDNPNATRDDYQELLASYKYLPQLTDYAKTQAEVKAAAAAKEEQKRQDDENYVAPKDFSLLTGTKAEKSPLDTEYLKSLGWDENTGFDWLIPNIPSREDLARAASSQPGGLFTQPQEQPSAASPVVDAFANLGAQAARPRPIQPAQNTGDGYDAMRTLGIGGGTLGPTKQVQDQINRAMGIGGELGKNAYAAVVNAAGGEPVKYDKDVSFVDTLRKAAKPTPLTQEQIAGIGVGSFGDMQGTANLINYITGMPWGRAIYEQVGTMALDPTTYIGAETFNIAKLAKAGKAAEAEQAASKLIAAMDDAKRAEAAAIMPKPRQITSPATVSRIERPTAITPAELVDLQGKGLRPQPRSLSSINADNEALAAERAAMEAQMADDAAGVSGLPKEEYMDLGPQSPPADFYVSPYGVASDNMAPQLALPAGPQPEVIGRAGARGKFPQPQQLPTPRRFDFNEPYINPGKPQPRQLQGPTGPQPLPLGTNTITSPQRIVEAPAPSYEHPMPRQFNEPATVTTGQKSFDAQKAAPENMAERGLSENIRTDANSPDALRDSFSQDPEFYKVVSNKDTLARAQAVYDQGAQAARTQLTTLVDQMKPEAVPLAKMLARDAVQANKLDEAREILSSVASKLTESGQFGQAARILRQSDPETVLMTLDKQLRKLNADGAKVYGKKWKDFDLLADEAAEITKINPGDEQAIETFMEKVHTRIADQMPSTALEKLTAWRHMSMLLNPKTHIRNIAGNALMAGVNRVSSRLSGVLQKVLPRDIRTAAPIVRREAKQLAAEFFTKHEKDLMQGGNKYNEGIGLNMPDKRVFKPRPLEAARKFNYKALDAEDKFFFSRAYKDRLASAIQARGLKLVDDIPQSIIDLAKSEAERAVFRDKSNLANAISKIKQGKWGAVVDTFLPFTKTPINIAKRGLDFSPGGIASGIRKLFNPTTAAEGMDDLAKGLTGTGIMALGYFLSDSGILTGAAPKDKDFAAYDKATGKAPFSIMGQYTYDWAQPVAIPLTVGVAVHDALQEDPQTAAKLRRAFEAGDTESIRKIASGYGVALLDAFQAAGDTMFNMSVLQGIESLFSNPNGIMAGLASLPANYVNQMIPTAAGQIARTIDPTIRQTYYGAGDGRNMTAPVINKIPGASTLLPPKITPFGQAQKAVENPVVRAFQNFVSPGSVTAKQDIDPQVDAELRRLYDTGQLKQFPTTVERTFKFMDRTVGLTDAEYTQYQRTVGQETVKAYKDIINSEEYRQIPKKELNEKLKALAATRGTTVQALRNDSAALTRIQEEYRAFLLAKGIQYAKALGQIEILRERGMIGNLTDKQLADRMESVTKEIAKKIR